MRAAEHIAFQSENTVSERFDELAKEVIQGKWGNGTERKNRLTQAGYNYSEVQARVDALLTK